MIHFEKVHKAFNGQQVLRGLDLDIPKGKITVILGQSGGGKTVMLKHMIGLLFPDRGRVVVNGVDIKALDDQQLNSFRKIFGMLFQGAALFDSMTVGQNVAFPIMEHKGLQYAEVLPVVKEKLRLVGLIGVEDKMPDELSGGMRKRVGLARAIALDPEILLYDEPTTGLDPVLTKAIDELITTTQKKLGITSVVISHDIPSAFRIADVIAMLHEGNIVFRGTPEEFRQTTHPLAQQFLKGGM